MIYVGCHLSVSDGYAAMGRKIIEFGGAAVYPGNAKRGCRLYQGDRHGQGMV